MNEGSSISLIVHATGSGRLTYQWRLAGRELPGKTRSILGLRILQANDAGLYSVVVSDSGGSVTSEDAALSVRVSVEPPFDPGLKVARDDTELTVPWEGEGTLERSSSLAGSWLVPSRDGSLRSKEPGPRAKRDATPVSHWRSPSPRNLTFKLAPKRVSRSTEETGNSFHLMSLLSSEVTGLADQRSLGRQAKHCNRRGRR